MMLRASVNDPNADMRVVTGESGDSGVPHDAALLALTEAVFRMDTEAANEARDAIAQAIDPQAAVDATAVAAHFNAITRVADATGVQLDRFTEENTGDLRAELDLNALDTTE